MPARIKRHALVLAFASSSGLAFGQVASSQPTVESPSFAVVTVAEFAQQPSSLQGPQVPGPSADSSSRKSQIDLDQSPSDVVNDQSPESKEGGTSQPSGPTAGGLQPRPSNDVLDAISAPNTLTDGMTPESAAASRGLDNVALPHNRGWMLRQVCWQSSNICHQPLYFEDAMLERHGHQRFPVLQPMISGSKFVASVVLMPYLTTLHHPNENRYALGHFRPGSCAPALKDTLPWDNRAAAAQALGVTGVLVGLPW